MRWWGCILQLCVLSNCGSKNDIQPIEMIDWFAFVSQELRHSWTGLVGGPPLDEIGGRYAEVQMSVILLPVEKNATRCFGVGDKWSEFVSWSRKRVLQRLLLMIQNRVDSISLRLHRFHELFSFIFQLVRMFPGDEVAGVSVRHAQFSQAFFLESVPRDEALVHDQRIREQLGHRRRVCRHWCRYENRHTWVINGVERSSKAVPNRSLFLSCVSFVNAVKLDVTSRSFIVTLWTPVLISRVYDECSPSASFSFPIFVMVDRRWLSIDFCRSLTLL